MTAALIALDWGTSSLRAWCLDEGGRVLDQHESPEGILHVKDGFAAAFDRITGAWRKENPNLPALASGMIGSAQGWKEAPYLPCPAGPEELAGAMIALPEHGLHIVPGVAQRHPADVMRGEETQIAGALALNPALRAEAHLVMPGTHSKWVTLRDGRIEGFTTFMTGELFAVLKDHSILGRFAKAPAGDDEAFSRGLQAAQEGDLPSRLFSARADVLLGDRAAASSLDYLSGLIIGAEIASALRHMTPQAAPVLIGAPALVDRYRRALAAFGLADAPAIAHTAVAGLWQIARAARLIEGTRP
ncbi:2-dehydro-3-deoxygalactonokinase [Falsirhodobacter sp. 20TX0035]|uniref:2-dehydro-3-deoxygalactonokinase n=1 Tax=Falsirhodobacter sp. 20TX0035 TaxID=3022019 RepID=UPI00232C0CB1|nr:2-dehydro-3-deoxygalactonokinase [Falsirhodobacter sp. 20TX0035]MDB6452949.1 2-dehydro-3-deoxygalactonokinase [Falsirhodobacter sp. 20TX0035]